MNTHTTHKTRASVRIDAELLAWAKEEAKRRGQTVSELAEGLLSALMRIEKGVEWRRGGVAAGEQG